MKMLRSLFEKIPIDWRDLINNFSIPTLPWHNAIWAQQVQFRDILTVLRFDSAKSPLDPHRLKSINDFQRIVPINFQSSRSPNSQNLSVSGKIFKNQLLLINKELNRAIKEARTTLKNCPSIGNKPTHYQILTIDCQPPKPEISNFHHYLKEFTVTNPGFLSNFIKTNRLEYQHPLNLKQCLRILNPRVIIGAKVHLAAWQQFLGYSVEEWIWDVWPKTQIIMTDQKTPLQKPNKTVWIETPKIGGYFLGHISPRKNQLQLWPKAGIFLEFICPQTNTPTNTKGRYWLANAPLEKPLQVVASTIGGMIAVRTNLFVTVLDRSKGILRIESGFPKTGTLNHLESQPNQPTYHPSTFGMVEDSLETLSHNAW